MCGFRIGAWHLKWRTLDATSSAPQRSAWHRPALIGCCVLAMALSGASGRAFGHDDHNDDDGPGNRPRASIAQFVLFGTQTVVPGSGSMLVRTREGVFATVHTQGLEEGTAVTAWWVFFNRPRRCATRPCTGNDLFSNPDARGSLINLGGRVVGADGAISIGAFRAVGDATGAAPMPVPNPGLLNPLSAEIHLVIRTHGAVIPGTLSEQLSMLNGGCPPNTCANVQASVHMP